LVGRPDIDSDLVADGVSLREPKIDAVGCVQRAGFSSFMRPPIWAQGELHRGPPAQATVARSLVVVDRLQPDRDDARENRCRTVLSIATGGDPAAGPSRNVAAGVHAAFIGRQVRKAGMARMAGTPCSISSRDVAPAPSTAGIYQDGVDAALELVAWRGCRRLHRPAGAGTGMASMAWTSRWNS
jgi:hypothetical protein